MDDDKIEKGVLPGEGGKRPPPTIDLTASDVSESRASSGASAADDAASPDASVEQPESAAAPDASAASSTESSSSAPASSPSRPGRASSVIASAITGAVAAALVIGAAKLIGWPEPLPVAPPVDTAARTDLQALAARVAKAETTLARPAPIVSAADPALRERLDALEKNIAALRDDVTAARDQSAKAVGAVNDGKSISAASAPSVDTSGLEERIEKVERAAATLSAAAAVPPPAPQPPADDPKLRRVAAATLLDSSVRQGEPYGAALSAARAASDDAATLKPLEAFAASGVPSAAALCRELLILLPQLAPKPATAAPSGLVERLQQSAAKLVRVQRIDAAPTGSDNRAVIARATAAARRDDVDEARRELLQLAPAERAPVQGWLARADARDAALAAARQFAADTATALAQPAR